MKLLNKQLWDGPLKEAGLLVRVREQVDTTVYWQVLRQVRWQVWDQVFEQIIEQVKGELL